MGYKVSVIIPLFNDEKYLERCLDSIVTQTLHEIEIIIIDDGSTDDSVSIIEKYASSDERFSVISQTNQGPGMARNRGLSIAKGEFIAFVDSDDLIDSEMLEQMYENASKAQADIVVCQFEKFDDKGQVYTTKEMEKETFQNLIAGKLYSPVWNKIYKRALFHEHGIVFPADIYYEDVATLFKLYFYAKKIITLQETYYHWYERPGSRTEVLNVLHVESMFRVFTEMEHFLISKKVEEHYSSSLFEKIVSGVLFLFRRIDSHVVLFEKKREVWQLLYREIEKSRYFSEHNMALLVDNSSYDLYEIQFYLSIKTIYTEYDRQMLYSALIASFPFDEKKREELALLPDGVLLERLVTYRRKVFAVEYDAMERVEFSQKLNVLFKAIAILKQSPQKVAIYGNGVIGQILARELAGRVVVIIDKDPDSLSEYAPTCTPDVLSHYDIDTIVIAVFGREAEIEKALLKEYPLSHVNIVKLSL